MEELKEKLMEILEVEELDGTKKFADYEEWDSLSVLSILAMLDADYGMQMKGADVVSYSSIDEFCDYVIANKK